jgi:hypothetical protein
MGTSHFNLSLVLLFPLPILELRTSGYKLDILMSAARGLTYLLNLTTDAGHMRRIPMMKAIILTLSTLLLVIPSSSFAQGSSAVPFLLISSSPEGNGMGGTAASTPSDDALATISNPGQLGLFSLNNGFNAEKYSPKTQWLPGFAPAGLTYYSEAANVGANVGKLCGLPFSLSAGFGYSHIDFDLGDFVITDETANILGQYHAFETSDNYSAGLGFEYYVKVGLGWNFKKITSNLNETAKVNATDFGVLVDAPVMKIVSAFTGKDYEIVPNVRPLLDLSFADVTSNVGGSVVYLDPAQGDPLPRTATIGGSIEGGLVYQSVYAERKLVTFTLIRQADDLLVLRSSSSNYSYQSGLGDIDFVDNVLAGKSNPNVNIRKGWQLQVAEALYVRGGSVEGPGLAYSTSGYSVSVRGFVRLIDLWAPPAAQSWIEDVTRHFDIRYHSSMYSSTSSPIAGTTTTAVNLVLDGFSF